MGRYGFYIICGILGFLFGLWDLELDDWKQWVLFLCVAGAYICGAYI